MNFDLIKSFRCASRAQKTPPRAFQAHFSGCDLSGTIGFERVLVPFLETSYCGASEHTVGVWSDDGLYPFWVYAMAQHTGMRKTPKAYYRYAIFASQGYATLYISTVLYCMYITVHSRYTVQTYLYSTVLYL